MQKSLSIPKKIDKFDHIKINNLCSSKDPTKECADKPRTNGIYLQHV